MLFAAAYAVPLIVLGESLLEHDVRAVVVAAGAAVLAASGSNGSDAAAMTGVAGCARGRIARAAATSDSRVDARCNSAAERPAAPVAGRDGGHRLAIARR